MYSLSGTIKRMSLFPGYNVPLQLYKNEAQNSWAQSCIQVCLLFPKAEGLVFLLGSPPRKLSSCSKEMPCYISWQSLQNFNRILYPNSLTFLKIVCRILRNKVENWEHHLSPQQSVIIHIINNWGMKCILQPWYLLRLRVVHPTIWLTDLQLSDDYRYFSSAYPKQNTNFQYPPSSWTQTPPPYCPC